MLTVPQVSGVTHMLTVPQVSGVTHMLTVPQVSDVSHMWDYLRGTLVPSLQVVDGTTETVHTADMSNVLVGRARLRQLRVTAGMV